MGLISRVSSRTYRVRISPPPRQFPTMFSSLRLFQDQKFDSTKYVQKSAPTPEAPVQASQNGYSMNKKRSGRSFNLHFVKVAIVGSTGAYVCFKLLQLARHSWIPNGEGLTEWKNQDNVQLRKDMEADWAVMQKQVDDKAAARKKIDDERKAWEEQQLAGKLDSESK